MDTLPRVYRLRTLAMDSRPKFFLPLHGKFVVYEQELNSIPISKTLVSITSICLNTFNESSKRSKNQKSLHMQWIMRTSNRLTKVQVCRQLMRSFPTRMMKSHTVSPTLKNSTFTQWSIHESTPQRVGIRPQALLIGTTSRTYLKSIQIRLIFIIRIKQEAIQCPSEEHLHLPLRLSLRLLWEQSHQIRVKEMARNWTSPFRSL